MKNNNSNDVALSASLTEQLCGQRNTSTFRHGYGIGAVNGTYGGTMTITSYNIELNLGTVELASGYCSFAFRIGEVVRAPACRGYGLEQEVELFEIETVAIDGGIGAALGEKLRTKFIAPELTFDAPNAFTL
jgi:hypothetical protein